MIASPPASSSSLSPQFRPSDFRMSAFVASLSGFSEWTDMIFSGSSFSLSMFSRNTPVRSAFEEHDVIFEFDRQGVIRTVDPVHAVCQCF